MTSPNRRIAMGTGLIAAAIALGLAVMAGWLAWFDLPLMRAVALTPASPRWLVAAAQVVTTFGDPDVRSGIAILVCAVFVARHCWRSAGVYLATVGLSIGGHMLAKLAFARPRPQLTPWFDQVKDLSYPSGHAAGSMVVLFGAAMLVRERWLRAPALVLALTIAATRPLLGVHWPTDIIGGALWGAGFALLGAGTVQALGWPKPRLVEN